MNSIRNCILNGRPAPSAHDTLELARIGTCQPHGVLIIADSQSGRINHISANCADLLGVEVADIIGQRVSDAFKDPASVAVLEDILQPGRLYFDNPQRASANGTDFEVVCHVRDGQLFVELEPYVEAANDYPTMVSHAMELLGRQTTRSGLYTSAVDLLQYVTGWDRVKLYKFVSHGHGVVVAEKKAADSALKHSFLNCYFSAGDTPEAALEILKTGKTRQKPTQAPSVLLMTKNADGVVEPTGANADLTDCWLRGIHSCDNGYNKNLGVGSNIIFPVIVDSELWGLFVVHNQEEAFLNYDSRAVIEQMTMMFIAKLLEVEETECNIKDRYDRGNALLSAIREAENIITPKGVSENNAAHALVAESMRRGTLSLTYNCPNVSPIEISGRRAGDQFAKDLLSLVNADGMAIIRPSLKGHIHLVGTTPEPLEVRGIASLFGTELPAFDQGEWRVFATDSLGDYTSLPDHVLSVSCGILAAPIGNDGDMIIWFREEQVLDVTWAGAPWTKKELNSDRMFRSRDDFKPTAGQLTGASRAWLDAEVILGARFAKTIGIHWENIKKSQMPQQASNNGAFAGSFNDVGQQFDRAFH